MNGDRPGAACPPSPYDIRTFAYVPSGVPNVGGVKYQPEDIEHQHKVGICTAISHTQQARKVQGVRFSADFQYLMEKQLDGNWDEGSSILTSLKVAKNVGLLPEDQWIFTTENDRLLPYDQYIAKLKSVPQAEIDKLKAVAANYKIAAYQQVPIDKAMLEQAVNESQAGILCRFEVGSEWWTGQIEPLRAPAQAVSGHAITMSNYNGDSYRLANTWGALWATGGTAYSLFSQYKPTEAWLVHYGTAPATVQKQIQERAQTQGKILDLLQQIISLYQQLIKSK